MTTIAWEPTLAADCPHTCSASYDDLSLATFLEQHSPRRKPSARPRRTTRRGCVPEREGPAAGTPNIRHGHAVILGPCWMTGHGQLDDGPPALRVAVKHGKGTLDTAQLLAPPSSASRAVFCSRRCLPERIATSPRAVREDMTVRAVSDRRRARCAIGGLLPIERASLRAQARSATFSRPCRTGTSRTQASTFAAFTGMHDRIRQRHSASYICAAVSLGTSESGSGPAGASSPAPSRHWRTGATPPVPSRTCASPTLRYDRQTFRWITKDILMHLRGWPISEKLAWTSD
ncbi:hypothetical protein HYPSUDRAFT_200057 [Hypholoma sublateritium FD-334 SS-4]|uniref:Uncharacterized protein n=1 Tax=Hypholoma sublateritium (strain FD-334 SS-4) TaxID=945553 RepID=A0A0D2P2P0_HYPSF|nr:hypothetical protein HYPSUDRAFT_200057 [Hypholoma sublateritium FD-334 SS-4]